MDSIDRRLATIASGQQGLVTKQQALAHGLGNDQIRARIRSGRWIRANRSVYRLAGVPETWQQRAFAACLAAPDGAHVSHLSAAALAGLDVPPPSSPHLTVGRGRSTRLAGAVVHCARLTPVDITTLQGVPATTVARSLIDCAGLLGPNRLQRLVDDALHKRMLVPAEIPSSWDKARLRPGRAGEVRLRAALLPWHGPIAPDTPPEARLRRQLVEWGYPEPEPQIRILDSDGRVLGRVDLGWSDRRIGVEYDSEQFHSPSKWASDEARHRAIEASGWRLLRADKLDLRPGKGNLREALARLWREPQNPTSRM